MVKILLVGPAGSLSRCSKNYFEKMREQGYIIWAYAAAIGHFYKIGFKPDVFTFFDPYSFVIVLQDMLKWDTSFFKDIHLVAADYYDSEEKYNNLRFRDHFSTPLDPKKGERNKKLWQRFLDMKISTLFKTASLYDPKVVMVTNLNQDIDIDYDKRFTITFIKMGINIDKFGCYVLPLIFHHYNNLTEIRPVGFGEFETREVHTKGRGRHWLRNIEEYKKTFDYNTQHLYYYLKTNHIKMNYEDSPNSYYRKLEGN